MARQNARWCRNLRAARPKIHSISASFRWEKGGHTALGGPSAGMHGFPETTGLNSARFPARRAGRLKKYLTNCDPGATCVSNKNGRMLNTGHEISVTRAAGMCPDVFGPVSGIVPGAGRCAKAALSGLSGCPFPVLLRLIETSGVWECRGLRRGA
jgi:hypothetical protein